MAALPCFLLLLLLIGGLLLIYNRPQGMWLWVAMHVVAACVGAVRGLVLLALLHAVFGIAMAYLLHLQRGEFAFATRDEKAIPQIETEGS